MSKIFYSHNLNSYSNFIVFYSVIAIFYWNYRYSICFNITQYHSIVVNDLGKIYYWKVTLPNSLGD